MTNGQRSNKRNQIRGPCILYQNAMVLWIASKRPRENNKSGAFSLAAQSEHAQDDDSLSLNNRLRFAG